MSEIDLLAIELKNLVGDAYVIEYTGKGKVYLKNVKAKALASPVLLPDEFVSWLKMFLWYTSYTGIPFDS